MWYLDSRIKWHASMLGIASHNNDDNKGIIHENAITKILVLKTQTTDYNQMISDVENERDSIC